MNIILAWIRRDMRLHDHAVLHTALKHEHPVQPVFIFDPDILARFDNPKDKRLSMLAKRLVVLHQELKKLGGGILVLYGKATEIIPKLSHSLDAGAVVAAQDHEPETRQRDQQVKQQLADHCAMLQPVDTTIIPVPDVTKADGDPYKVFTPYSKAWRTVLTSSDTKEQTLELKGRLAAFDEVCHKAEEAGLMRLKPEQGAEAMLEAMGYELVDIAPWQVEGTQSALHNFARQAMGEYKDRRDTMADEGGTSRLSPYLRFGFISVRECARLALNNPSKGSDGWLNELIWREFYMQIMWHFPESAREEFQQQYRGLNWSQDEALLQAWKDGKTGFPIVDAAMRELKKIGWMHNRARMIVSSFLTKDLRLDWRLGEEHFAQYLMDYELSSNVGGWQWAASTGTDAQPYFRIFNPQRQSERFDPDAAYIRKYVPELKELYAKEIHKLHSGSDLLTGISDYPAPVVDHQQAKQEALAMFKSAS